MNRFLMAVGTLALATGCTTAEPPIEGPAAPLIDPSSPLAAPNYLRMAASSDLFEIQSGQMAAQMSQNAAVRNYGNLLVAHHTHTTAQLAAAAQAAGLAPPPPVLMPEHQALLEQLRTAGPNFNVAFRDVQVQAHQAALGLHQNYASGGDQPALRNVAGAAVPIIQQHLAAAQALNVMPMAAPMAPAPQPMGEPAPSTSGKRG